MKEEPNNPRIDPELEARIVALVLGEASDFERAELDRLIEQQPQWAAFKTQIQNVHGLLEEIGSGDTVAKDDWKLSPEKRSAVLNVISGQAERQPTKPVVNHFTSMPSLLTKYFPRNVIAIAAVALCALGLGVSSWISVLQRDAATQSYAVASADHAPDAILDLETSESIVDGDSPVGTSRSALSAIQKSLDGDGAQPSPYYLMDDVQYFPAGPEFKLSRRAAALKKTRDVEELGRLRTAGTVGPANATTGGQQSGPQPAESTPGVADSDVALGLEGEKQKDAKAFQTRLDFGTQPEREKESNRFSDNAPFAEKPPNPVQLPSSFRNDLRRGAANGGVARGLESAAQPSAPVATGEVVEGRSEGGFGGGGFDQYGGGMGGGRTASADQPSNGIAADGKLDGIARSLSRGAMRSGTERSSTQWQSLDRLRIPTGPESGIATRAAGGSYPEVPLGYYGKGLQDGRIVAGDQSKSEELSELSVVPSDKERLLAERGKTPIVGDFAIDNGVALGQNRIDLERAGQSPPADATYDYKSALEGSPSKFDLLASKSKNQWGASITPRFEYDSQSSNTKTSAKKLAPPVGLDEVSAEQESFSTFSLHVSDVSFKLAQAALARGEWPEAEKVRIEEFVNAFDYGDPLPSQTEKVACRVEQSIHPFLQQRNLLRVSLRTAAAGRLSNTPLRLTLLLDNSGSMERIDRQQTVRRAFSLLAQQLKPIDQVTLISFARQPRLLADKVSGDQSSQLVGLVDDLPSEGGTNLEAALKLASEKAREHQTDGAQNRVILLTDGAVNLGDANPESLSRMITTMRDVGIAFDAAGISAEGLNDEILEALTRKGDGRYYLLDSMEAADDGFAGQIAGALRPSAKNVKVQIEFNPNRVGHYKLLGFEKHRLKKEDFRNDRVDAAELAAEEAGVAVYQFEAKPDGEGDVGSVSVRFLDLSNGQMVENRWPIPYEPEAPRFDQAAPSLRIAASAALLAAKLRGEPLGGTFDLKELASLISGLPVQDRNSMRIQQLQLMIGQARQVSGK